MLADYKRERRRQSNLKFFKSILVASHYMAEEYLRQGVPSERVQVLPLFPASIVPDRVEPKPLSDWTNKVMLMGRLTDLKGAGLVVQAVSAASKRIGRRLTLVVLGDGPGRKPLEEQAATLDVQLELSSWKAPEERNIAMRNSDALIVPSLWPEPFGLVGIEAGCVGLPSVAFDVGGISDWLEHGVSGRLAAQRPFSGEDLGRVLAEVLDNFVDHHRYRVGAWNVAQRYSEDRHINSLIQTLNRIRG